MTTAAWPERPLVATLPTGFWLPRRRTDRHHGDGDQCGGEETSSGSVGSSQAAPEAKSAHGGSLSAIQKNHTPISIGGRPAVSELSRRPDLHKPGRVEVTIECKRLADPAAAHHREAGRIHKGVLTLVVATKPAPGICLRGCVDMHDLDIGELGEAVDEPYRREVAGAPTKQRPSLADDMVGDADTTHPGPHQRPCVVVVAVASLGEREPEAGVGEPHAFGP